MDHSLLLGRKPWHFSGCSEKEETNDANENCKSAKEVGDSISDPSVSESVTF
jgi:hypothetical protein